MTALKEPLKLGSFVVTSEAAMSKEKCESILAPAEGKLTPSGLLGEQRDEYRTSSGAWLGPDETGSAQAAMRQLVVEITGQPLEHRESSQVLRYEPGQEYRQHQDFWHPDTDYYDAQMTRGGQRAWSVLVYLNDVPAGGGTRFPILGIDVSPKTGKVLAWQKTIDGELNYDSLHAGLPVTQGTKWMAITWVREQPFI